jgi:hypothetical protein
MPVRCESSGIVIFRGVQYSKQNLTIILTLEGMSIEEIFKCENANNAHFCSSVPAENWTVISRGENAKHHGVTIFTFGGTRFCVCAQKQ